MKKLFILFAAVIGFAACNEEESINMDEVLNEYSLEQLNALVERFDPSQINQSELIRDLTTGSIDCGTSFYYKNGEWKSIKWEGALYAHNAVHVVMIFNDDGTGIRYFLNCYNTSYEKIGTVYRDFEWKYDAKQGQIHYRMDADDSVWQCFEVKFYKSPMLIFDGFYLNEEDRSKEDPTYRARRRCNLALKGKIDQLEQYKDCPHAEDVDLLNGGWGMK